MKYLYLFLILPFISCTKTENRHFHGRFTFDCNDQPIGEFTITISRIPQNGSTWGDLVGSGASDANGNFSIMSDYKPEGDFKNYNIFIQSTQNASPFSRDLYSFENYDEDNDVEISHQFPPTHIFSFHIKNVSPVDSLDTFESLMLAADSDGTHPIYRSLFLKGTDVDTTLVFEYGKDAYITYRFTKAAFTIEKADSVVHDTGCLDTVNVDVFY